MLDFNSKHSPLNKNVLNKVIHLSNTKCQKQPLKCRWMYYYILGSKSQKAARLWCVNVVCDVTMFTTKDLSISRCKSCIPGPLLSPSLQGARDVGFVRSPTVSNTGTKSLALLNSVFNSWIAHLHIFQMKCSCKSVFDCVLVSHFLSCSYFLSVNIYEWLLSMKCMIQIKQPCLNMDCSPCEEAQELR